jgi:hypothetical protein
MLDDRDVLEREMNQMRPRPFGLDDIVRRRERKRRNQRLVAGVVAIAIFVVPVAVILANGGWSGRTQAPADDGPTVAPDVFPQVGLVGLPPAGATPSTPTRGELVASFLFGHTQGDPGRFHVYLYADGRLISWQLDSQRGYVEQRLTSEGVQQMTDEVLGSGLFDGDLPHLAGMQDLFFGQIGVRTAERFITVTWGDCCDPRTSAQIQVRPTSAQASAIRRLSERVEDPASWLPASAWEDSTFAPYVASRYSVCYESQQATDLSGVLSSLPRPAQDMLAPLDRTHEEIPQLHARPILSWCSHFSVEDARSLVRILLNAGIGEGDFGDLLSFDVGKPADAGGATDVGISLGPVLPHDV